MVSASRVLRPAVCDVGEVMDSVVPGRRLMEHRLGTRVPLCLPARLDMRGETSALGCLLNVSLSGAYVATPRIYQLLSPIDILCARFGDDHAEPSGVSAYVIRKAELGVGVEWREFAPQTIRLLVKLAQSTPWNTMPFETRCPPIRLPGTLIHRPCLRLVPCGSQSSRCCRSAPRRSRCCPGRRRGADRSGATLPWRPRMHARAQVRRVNHVTLSAPQRGRIWGPCRGGPDAAALAGLVLESRAISVTHFAVVADRLQATHALDAAERQRLMVTRPRRFSCK